MHVIDSHTGGMPTRVILGGGPDLGSGSLAQQAQRLAADHGAFMRRVLAAPRGQVGMVGALLVPPVDRRCAAGVIYFDAGAVLGMCGHGTIGLAVTLARQGVVSSFGEHWIETPVGCVEVRVNDMGEGWGQDGGTVTVTNVESHRLRAGVTLEVDGFGPVTGDVAFGGNWFFIVDPAPLPVQAGNISALTDAAIAVRRAAWAAGLRGTDGAPIDHVIFQGPAPERDVHSRNFVLCPDDSYDRSPCGTGSSARLACLAAAGGLPPGQEIIQHSVIGSPFRLSYRPGSSGGVIPRITGTAYITADSRLIFAPPDPFVQGIPA